MLLAGAAPTDARGGRLGAGLLLRCGVSVNDVLMDLRELRLENRHPLLQLANFFGVAGNGRRLALFERSCGTLLSAG